jgi:hypothetical protein
MHKQARRKPSVDVKPKLQSRQVTAQQGGVHVRTIDEMIKRGELEVARLGRRVMVKIVSAERLFGT